MKKTGAICGLLMLCSGIFSYRVCAEPAKAVAYQAEKEIVVDGELSEWNLSSPIEIKDAAQIIRDAGSWMGENDLSGTVYLMWDEEKLYLAAEIKEASAFGAVGLLEHDMEDNFKLYISTNPDSDPERNSYDTNDFLLYLMMDNQNWYTAFDRSMVEREKLERFTSEGMEGSIDALVGYEKAYTTIEGGFIFEAAIPWANFSNDYIAQYTPSVGDTVNFDFCITDNDYPFPNTEASVQMSWCGTKEINTNPGLWGRLTFE